jgi:hypothetical protein
MRKPKRRYAIEHVTINKTTAELVIVLPVQLMFEPEAFTVPGVGEGAPEIEYSLQVGTNEPDGYLVPVETFANRDIYVFCKTSRLKKIADILGPL